MVAEPLRPRCQRSGRRTRKDSLLLRGAELTGEGHGESPGEASRRGRIHTASVRRARTFAAADDHWPASQRQQNALETCARSMWRRRVRSTRGFMGREFSRSSPRRSMPSRTGLAMRTGSAAPRPARCPAAGSNLDTRRGERHTLKRNSLTTGGFDARTRRGTQRCMLWCAPRCPAACRLLPYVLRRLSFHTHLTAAGCPVGRLVVALCRRAPASATPALSNSCLGDPCLDDSCLGDSCLDVRREGRRRKAAAARTGPRKRPVELATPRIPHQHTPDPKGVCS